MMIPSSWIYCSMRFCCTTPTSSGGAISCHRLTNPGKTYCGKGSRAKCEPYTLLFELPRLNVVSETNSRLNVRPLPDLIDFAFSTRVFNEVNPVHFEESS